MAFELNDRVALKTEVAEGKLSFYRIKKVLKDGYTIGKCSCRPDLYQDVKKDELYGYTEAKTILTEKLYGK